MWYPKHSFKAAAAIAASAGLAIPSLATVFHFTPTCTGSNWYGECSSTPCGGGGYNTFNNWGYSACTGGLPTPGPADYVAIGNNAAVLNGTASVGWLEIAPGSQLYWSSGNLAVANPVTNQGLVQVLGGDKVLTGTFVNEASWINSSGYTLFLDGADFTNNATVDMVNKAWSTTGSGGTLVNNGTIQKYSAPACYIDNFPVLQNGVVSVTDGPLYFRTLPMTCTPSCAFTTSGSELSFVSCTLQGHLNVTNQGACTIRGGLSIDADTQLNVLPNPLYWNDGNINAGANTVTNMPGSTVQVAGGDKVLMGNWINNGTWANTDGYTLFLGGASFVNNATLSFVSKAWNVTTGGGSLVNNGTIEKHSGNACYIDNMPVTQRGILTVADGSLYFRSLAIDSSLGASYTVSSSELSFQSCTLGGEFQINNQATCTIRAGATIGADVNFTVAPNPIQWTDGNINSTGHTFTNNSGGLFRVNGGDKVFTGTLINNGYWLNADGYTLFFQNGGLTNAGTMEFSNKNMNNAGSGYLTNNGDILHTGSNYNQIASLPVTQNGAVHVNAGQFYFAGDTLTSTGASTYSTAPDTELSFQSCSLGGSFNINNQGAATIRAGMTLLAPATIHASPNPIQWADGNFNLAGSTLTNAAGAGFQVNGGDKVITGNVLNAGTWTGVQGYTLFLAAGTFTNNATLELQNKNVNNSGGGAMVNNGAIHKTVAAANSINSLPITQNGSLAVSDSSLTFGADTISSTSSSSYSTTSSGTLWFAGCNLSGRFFVDNQGAAGFGSGLTLGADTSLRVSPNPLVWNDGNVDLGTFTLTTNAPGSVEVYAGDKVLSNGRVINYGTWSLSQSYTMFFGSLSFTNNGTIDFVNKNVNVSANPATLINNSLIRKASGSANGIYNLPIVNAGQVQVTAGRLDLFGDGFSQAATGIVSVGAGATVGSTSGALTLGAGTLTGSGTVATSVVNNGAFVAPGGSPGTLTILGDYTQNPGGYLVVEIGGTTPDTEFDVLRVIGAANLGGSVRFQLVNGYVPGAGDTMRFVNSNTRNGTFSSAAITNGPHGLSYAIDYDANGAILRILGCSPCTACDADYNQDGSADFSDLLDISNDIATGQQSFPPSDPDFNQDGSADLSDVIDIANVIAGGPCP